MRKMEEGDIVIIEGIEFEITFVNHNKGTFRVDTGATGIINNYKFSKNDMAWLIKE
jgi:Cu2+-containing amine oxidase